MEEITEEMEEQSITDQLISVVQGLSKDHQRILLQFIETAGWKVSSSRKYVRKDLVPAGYTRQESEAPFLIKNLSVGGAFIETDKKLSIGQTISLDFAFDDTEDTFTISGKVMRSNRIGFGIAFNIEDANIKKMLQKRLAV